jgi:hypothetical protein
MSRIHLLVALSLFVTSPLRAQTTADASGRWEGTIQIPDEPLRIDVDLAKNPQGVWIGSISIPASTTLDVPLADITVNGMAVRFMAALPDKATFEGKLSADAQSLSGTVTNRMGGVPFRLTRRGAPNVKVPPPSSPLSKEFEGTWEGIISAGGNVIRMVLKLSAAADGTAIGTLTTIDQNQEIPVTTVTIKGKQLQLESRSVSATYFGTLGANGDITGNWIQLGDGPPLTFKRVSP